MKDYIARLPQEIQEIIYTASRVAGQRMVNAYLVGGFVRDLMLGVENFDVDITVEGEGIAFAEELSARLGGRILRHQRFGTANLTLKHHLKVDVATVRKEHYPAPAALPRVSAGSLRDDLARRDFTINAMAMSLRQEDFGRVVDFFDGARDLKRKKVRILHDASFIDDPTRILRAIRFEQRYRFTLEAKTLARLKEAARLRMLQKVQPQRIRDELILLLKEKEPRRPLRRLAALAGFDFLSPGLKAARRIFALLDAVHAEVSWFSLACTHRRRLDTWLIYFMALLDPLSRQEAGRVMEALALHRGEKKRVASAQEFHPKLLRLLGSARAKPAALFRLLEPLSYEAILFIKARCRRNRPLQINVERYLAEHSGTCIHVSGEDLRKMGIQPGPAYQKIFRRVLAARIDGAVRTKDEELALIGRMVKGK